MIVMIPPEPMIMKISPNGNPYIEHRNYQDHSQMEALRISSGQHTQVWYIRSGNSTISSADRWDV